LVKKLKLEDNNRKNYIQNEYSQYWLNARANQYKLTSYDQALVSFFKEIPSSRILEVGIGTGEVIAENFLDKDMHGIDISDILIERCQQLFPKIKSSVGDAENLVFEDGFFDLCFCVHSTWYFPDVNKAISEMIRVTKKNGHVCFDIQNIINKDIKSNFKRHVFENKNLLGMIKKFLRNCIKFIVKKGQTEWTYSVYEVPSDPILIINELRLKEIHDFKTYIPTIKNNSTILTEIKSNFDKYPRIIFLVKV
jgi:ubiquinone/menaquinone biosynthesis C-methylase UbiE